HDFQRPDGIELWLVIVGQDQVQLGVEVGLVARLVVHPAPIELIAGPAELVKGQVGVLRPVFEDQSAKWSSSHGDAAMQRLTEQLVASVTGSRDSEPGG